VSIRLIKNHQQKSAPKDGYRQLKFIIVAHIGFLYSIGAVDPPTQESLGLPSQEVGCQETLLSAGAMPERPGVALARGADATGTLSSCVGLQRDTPTYIVGLYASNLIL